MLCFSLRYLSGDVCQAVSPELVEEPLCFQMTDDHGGQLRVPGRQTGHDRIKVNLFGLIQRFNTDGTAGDAQL